MFREGPQAFIALPQGAPNSELRTAIEKTLDEHGVTAASAEGVGSVSSVAAGIQDRLRETDFVIADISGANPNVMIEVGMALGMGKRILLLSTERSSALPFDLATHQVAVYRPGDVGSVRKYLELWLRDAMSERGSSSF